MYGRYKKTRILSIIALAAIFSIARPQPAHAQLVTIDPAAIAKMITDEIQRAATFTANYVINVQHDLVNEYMAQANVDAQDKAVHDAKQLYNNMDHTVHAETTKACSTTQESAAAKIMRAGAAGLTSSMAAAVNQGVAKTPGAALKSACTSGNIDPKANPIIAAAIGNCTADTNTARIDADINFASVVNADTEVPPGLKIANGQMTIPTPTLGAAPGSDAAKQNAYIDALNVCINRRGLEQDSLGGNPASSGGTTGGKATPTLATVGFHAQRMNKLALSPAYTDCLSEVNRHAAITQAASSISPDFMTMYNATQHECAALADQGIDDPAIVNCTKSGISLATLEEIRKSRFSSPTYKQNLAGRNMTAEDITKYQLEHDDMAMLSDQLREIAAALHAVTLNTQPANNAPAPNPMDNPVQASATETATLHRVSANLPISR